MMGGAALRLVLLVSCAHALVHVYELALPSVELQIAAEYRPDDVLAGKAMTGRLSNYWRLTFGLGALAAGWLVDRWGARRMLALYLLGCAAMCVAAGSIRSFPALAAAMLAMGAFACIYHPAGLALISHHTTAENRARALGVHGIFGSTGIASAPLIVGALMACGWTWRQYYWALAVPGLVLGLVFAAQAGRDRPAGGEGRRADGGDPSGPPARWGAFFVLTGLAVLQGFVYSGFVSFLTRYISAWRTGLPDLEHFSQSSFIAAAVLLAGCVGQMTAGALARPRLLERQLTGVTMANVPLLLWMALAGGWRRLAAAAVFSVVHFMHQPLYNTLIAKYTPPHRRSLAYGFSFAMGLGLGSFGARFAGYSRSDWRTYGMLAAMAAAASVLGLVLCVWNPAAGPQRAETKPD